MPKLTRRQLLHRLGAAGAGAAAMSAGLLPSWAQGAADPHFIIVITALGGASIIDGPLAIRQGESSNWRDLNTFPDREVEDVPDSPFRAVNLRRENAGAIPFPFETNQSELLSRLKEDMMVVTHTTTSVNHTIAQKRSLTGNSAWNGRTLQEVISLTYGEGMPLPNVNMSTQGYLEPGEDVLPAWAAAEPVANPALWPLSLDGVRGVEGAPSKRLVDLARRVRDGKLDAEGTFHETFAHAEAIKRWRQQREHSAPALEGLDLISRLNIFPDTNATPLSRFGLAESEDGARLRAVFPRFLSDPFEAQAAIAFLLLKNRLTTSVTLGPGYSVLLEGGRGLRNPPLAFDFSHQAHRPAQAIMWQRILGVADRLKTLLQSEVLDEGRGLSFWDRTLIYIATDFGRGKRRPAGADEFGTSHNLNNGSVILSPLVRGNSVLGGVDPETGMTYGFDPRTGAPDTNRHMSEAELYAGILQALKVETPAGLPDMRAMRA